MNRKGSRFGNDTIVDGMLKDGLWDVYNDFAMGVCAEMCASQHSITREEQVEFSRRGVSLSTSNKFYFHASFKIFILLKSNF